MKTLYLDCFCGAAGDMLVGALIDAGADFGELKKSLDTLGVDGYTLSCEKIDKHGTMATKFDVHVDDQHDHPHRHLRHIVDIIEAGDLSDAVKKASLETFQSIAECEAEVHGSTIQAVHFHEVGAVDSIVDIVGTHLALEQLKPERIVSSALHVGSGTVKCAHGIMPVPAPATALLLRGVPSYGGDVDGELVTPTGAALVAQLAESFGSMPMMTVSAIGVGSGTKDIPDRPNVVRAIFGEAADVVSGVDSIVGFKVDEKSGRLEMIGHTACEHVPRSFTVDETGKFVYVAGQGDDKLGVYQIDTKTGKLKKITQYDVGARPSWVECLMVD